MNSLCISCAQVCSTAINSTRSLRLCRIATCCPSTQMFCHLIFSLWTDCPRVLLHWSSYALSHISISTIPATSLFYYTSMSILSASIGSNCAPISNICIAYCASLLAGTSSLFTYTTYYASHISHHIAYLETKDISAYYWPYCYNTLYYYIGGIIYIYTYTYLHIYVYI